jgi:hypothetical protein
VSLATYIRLLIGSKSERNRFFLDPRDHPVANGVSEEARAVLFSMNPQFIAFYVSRVEGVDVAEEVFDYYEKMESNWPAMGNPNEEPWMAGPGPAATVFAAGGAAWSYPDPRVWNFWPKTYRLSSGRSVPVKLSGEGLLPGAVIHFTSDAGQHFSQRSAEADWDKKSFRVTHIKTTVDLTSVTPGLYRVSVRNLNWLQPLKWKTGFFDIKP